MVLPDGTKSDRSRPDKGRSLLYAVAALAIVAGFVALGSLSPSDPVAIETTTTTTTPSTTLPDLDPPFDPESFSVSQIATGPPLEWDRVANSTTGYPVAVIEHEGTFYLFTSGEAPWPGELGGLVTWRSSDGTDWQPVGEMVIGREFQVTDVITSADGFIAIGARPGGNHLIVWRSDDGIEWTATEIPTDADSPYMTPRATAAATLGDGLAITPRYELDHERLVTDHLAAAGIEIDVSMMSWNTRHGGEDGVELTVRGPLGIPVLTTSLDELGLTEQEHRWVMRGLDRGEQSEIWVVDDDGDRESGTIPLMGVSDMVSRRDGTLLATGFGGAGLDDGFVSTDGLHWEQADVDNISRAVSWGDRLIGVTSGPDPLEVLMSSDGQTWKESGAADLFPSRWSWHPVAMGAGPNGLAMTLEGQNVAGFTREAPSTATVTSGDATLRLDRQRSVFVLEIDGETHIWDRYPSSSSQVPDELEIDLASETILFQDPETGETLAQFSFEELRRLGAETRSIQFSDVIDHHALAFTGDGSGWEIRDLEPVVGDDSRVRLIEVAHGRLVAVVHKPLFDPTQNVPPAGFEIWTAPLP